MQQHRVEPTRRVYTVSELTQDLKNLLEEAFPFVWVTGEISNFHAPGSGHFYFTLKDPDAQMNAVMFKGQNRTLRFEPEDGMAVLAMGRLNVYEPRGTYQIIVEYLEPSGIGALQLAFEQLKQRLGDEGLFDERHKKALPYLPQNIGVITSLTGAVIRDILHVLNRRFPNLHVLITPVKVQGAGAAEEIVNAIDILNAQGVVEIIILARGGGSLEDLQPFNTESVARAIFASNIAVVSAIGHETDFTIADFVADVRAPTPSAAAEMVIPEKNGLARRLQEIRNVIEGSVLRRIRLLAQRSSELANRLVPPHRKIADRRMRLDDKQAKLRRALAMMLTQRAEAIRGAKQRVLLSSPKNRTKQLYLMLERNVQALSYSMHYCLSARRNTFRVTVGKLNALNPLAVLERGYSVTRVLPGKTVMKDVSQVRVGQRVMVTVWRGEAVCRVEEKREHVKTNI
jgi:exodeoxyribonuclease VII large subunit